MRKIHLSIRIDSEVIKITKEIAALENRNISNTIETLIKEAINNRKKKTK